MDKLNVTHSQETKDYPKPVNLAFEQCPWGVYVYVTEQGKAPHNRKRILEFNNEGRVYICDSAIDLGFTRLGGEYNRMRHE